MNNENVRVARTIGYELVLMEEGTGWSTRWRMN
ncbi:hypothetical protein sync_2302 [Synechococcus sp. CC9311]|nr:hypothetical protein sync_2302 [Synechococcus sp. CC9311]